MFKKYYRLNLLTTTSLNTPPLLGARLRRNLAPFLTPTKEAPDARS
jgi:hypothetical protein